MALSSRGPGHQVLNLSTRVRISLALLNLFDARVEQLFEN